MSSPIPIRAEAETILQGVPEFDKTDRSGTKMGIRSDGADARLTWRPKSTERGDCPLDVEAKNVQVGQFAKFTNVWQSKLWSIWDSEYPNLHKTCCVDFAVNYCTKLLNITLRPFFLEETVTSLDQWISYVPTGSRRRPELGDICKHNDLHVSVHMSFNKEDGRRCSAAAGQGNPARGYDILGRVWGDKAYDWRNLSGWIDIRAFAGLPPMKMRTATWVAHRRNWKVFYGHAFPMYYRFLPNGLVLRMLWVAARRDVPFARRTRQSR